MSAAQIPVLIAGGGPVGLALAIELGMAGIPCTVVERRDGSVSVPKMSGLSIRSMEFNRRWGIAEKVKRAGWPQTRPHDFVYCTSMTGPELARFKVPSYADTHIPFTPEPGAGCAQIYYDPILLERARSLPPVTLRHMTSLDRFTQDADGVRATVTDRLTGKTETIEALYLVGCDGADGTVVTALGFGYEGLGIVSNSVNVYFRSRALMTIHDKGWARFFRFTDEGGTWGEIIGIDGEETWRLSVLQEVPGCEPAAYMRRLAGRDFDYEILSAMRWERRERVAEHYRQGRVFIAGDAAHQNSPTGGLGLHTGLADAVDLGWKLAAVLKGWGGPNLLDAYKAERQPIALHNVRVSTDEFNIMVALPTSEDIAAPTQAGAEARKRFLEAFIRTGRGRSAIFTENLRLGYCYEPSPICVPDGTKPIPFETPEFIAVARPGTRAPHAWIGENRSTLDLFGEGFVLLRLGSAPPSGVTLVEAAKKRGVPLKLVDLRDEKIAALYERSLVLVRPDGHIAWRDDRPPADGLSLIDRVRGA